MLTLLNVVGWWKNQSIRTKMLISIFCGFVFYESAIIAYQFQNIRNSILRTYDEKAITLSFALDCIVLKDEKLNSRLLDRLEDSEIKQVLIDENHPSCLDRKSYLNRIKTQFYQDFQKEEAGLHGQAEKTEEVAEVPTETDSSEPEPPSQSIIITSNPENIISELRQYTMIIDGKKVRHIEYSTNLNGVTLIFDLSDLPSRIFRELMFLLFSAVGNLVVVFLIVWLLLTKFIAPLKDLAEFTQEIIQTRVLSTGQQIRLVEVVSQDEVGKLGKNFNTMLLELQESYNQLQQYNLDLEDKVKARTRELSLAKVDADSANRAKSQFLANMSHELRTPLNGILGYAQILSQDTTLATRQRERVDVINRSGEHLLSLINEVLDLSKIEAGKVELVMTDFRLSEMLRSVADLIRIRAEQKGISFEYEVTSRLPEGIRGDEKRLRQVLINLLGNSVKFTDEGKVTLGVERLGKKLRFQVEDTGLGMAPESLDQIFQAFQQVGDQKKMAEGTGLGLAISNKLVVLMGGEIQVDSQLGQGTRFWFDLEFREAQVSQASGKEKRLPVGFSGRERMVLIVDDKTENRAILVDLLSPLGFRLLEAANGREGLDQTFDHHPDLILIDLNMPVMGGREVIRKIRQSPEGKEVIIFVVTASVFEESREESLKLGADGFIPKPVRLEELLELMRKYLKLEWIYDKEEDIHTNVSSIPEAFPVERDIEDLKLPTHEELAVLFDFAMKGNLRGLQEYANTLEQKEPEYSEIVSRLRHLTKGIKIKEVKALIKSVMQSLRE